MPNVSLTLSTKMIHEIETIQDARKCSRSEAARIYIEGMRKHPNKDVVKQSEDIGLEDIHLEL